MLGPVGQHLPAMLEVADSIPIIFSFVLQLMREPGSNPTADAEDAPV
jgi:hypothetical protein